MVGDVDVSAMDDAAVTAVIAQYEKRTIEDHDEAIRLDPGNAIAYYNRASAHGNKGEYDRAIEDYSKAIGLNPTYTCAYWLLGDQDKAREDLERARAIKPDLPTWQARFREFEALF